MTAIRLFVARLLAAALWLAIAAGAARAQTPPDVTVLGDFIRANRAASPYAVGLRTSDQWCYDTVSEVGLDYWDYVEPLTGLHTVTAVWNAFTVPFFFGSYGARGVNAAVRASIVVGFELTNYNGPLPLSRTLPRATPASTDPCELGEAIYMRAPFPITVIPTADQIALVSTIDPAQEYRWWHILGQTERVRLVERIPVTYSVNGNPATGYIVVGFGQVTP